LRPPTTFYIRYLRCDSRGKSPIFPGPPLLTSRSSFSDLFPRKGVGFSFSNLHHLTPVRVIPRAFQLPNFLATCLLPSPPVPSLTVCRGGSFLFSVQKQCVACLRPSRWVWTQKNWPARPLFFSRMSMVNLSTVSFFLSPVRVKEPKTVQLDPLFSRGSFSCPPIYFGR